MVQGGPQPVVHEIIWNYNLTPFSRRVNITIYPFILFSGRLWGGVYKDPYE